MKTRLRTQQVYIDRPVPGADDWLRVVIQRVEMDDDLNTLNVVDRWGQVNVKLPDIFGQIYPFTDPYTPPENSISVAGAGVAITSIVTGLIIDKYGGEFDAATGYIMVD